MRSIWIHSFILWSALSLLVVSARAEKFADKKEYCENYIAWLYQQSSEDSFAEYQKIGVLKFILLFNEITKKENMVQLGDNEKIGLERLGNEFQSNFDEFKRYVDTSKISYIGPPEQPAYHPVFPGSESITIKNLIKQLHRYQTAHPKLFSGIAQKYLIDEWDLLTQERKLDKKHEGIELRFNSNEQSVIKRELDKLMTKNKESVSDLLKENAKNYLKDCNAFEHLNILKNYHIQCPQEIQKKPIFELEIDDLSILLKSSHFRNLINSEKIVPPVHVKQPFWPLDYRKTLEYDKNAYYCKRSTDTLTTIIFHHTATRYDQDINIMNDYHLSKHGMYMIGYHYLISGLDNGEISQGRQDWMKGAHAGTWSVMEADEYKHVKDKLDRKGLLCGNDRQIQGKVKGASYIEEELFYEKGNKPGANALSLGVAFSGDYDRGANPSKPNAQAIDNAAKLICNLQKKYPSIKTIGAHRQYAIWGKTSYFYWKPHDCYAQYTKKENYKKTPISVPYKSCPGEIMFDVMKEVQSKAARYGCEFSLNSTWIAPLCVHNKDIGR